MKIEVFVLCYNEEIILPFFLQHYCDFANVIIYDNESTDSSTAIAENFGAKVITYNTNKQIRDDVYLDIKNSCWKESDADWVIVVDADEFIYHKNLVEILKSTPESIIVPQGYEMISEDIPKFEEKSITSHIKEGIKYDNSSKPCIFSPKKLKEINFTPGCHSANPVGDISYNINSGIKLLHYKHINREYVINKHSEYQTRLSLVNKQNRWGHHYNRSNQEIHRLFDDYLNNSKSVI